MKKKLFTFVKRLPTLQMDIKTLNYSDKLQFFSRFNHYLKVQQHIRLEVELQ